MRTSNVLVTLGMLLAGTTWAQAPLEESPLPPPPSVAASAPVEPEPQVSEHSVGLHVGANLGLFSIDVHHGNFYGFAAANAGVPLVTNGELGAFVIALGATKAISDPGQSMWYFDFYGMALPGWRRQFFSMGAAPNVGVGVGAGFRYLHRSGLTLGFKLPVFGVSFGAGTGRSGNTAEMVGAFYVSSAVALPFLSLGYRF